MELPSGRFSGSRVDQSAVQGKWSVRNRRRRFRKQAGRCRQLDSELRPCARGRLSSGPCGEFRWSKVPWSIVRKVLRSTGCGKLRAVSKLSKRACRESTAKETFGAVSLNFLRTAHVFAKQTPSMQIGDRESDRETFDIRCGYDCSFLRLLELSGAAPKTARARKCARSRKPRQH